MTTRNPRKLTAKPPLIRYGSLLLVVRCRRRLRRGLARPFDEAHDETAQGAHILLGHADAMEDLAQVQLHDRSFGRGPKEAALIELVFEKREKRKHHLAWRRGRAFRQQEPRNVAR